MIFVKQHKKDEMKDIVLCPSCDKKEYYGMMTWYNGHQYCRTCTYERWMREGFEAAKHREDVRAATYGSEPDYSDLKYWKVSKDDYEFPYYEDGKDYFNIGDDYYGN